MTVCLGNCLSLSTFLSLGGYLFVCLSRYLSVKLTGYTFVYLSYQSVSLAIPSVCLFQSLSLSLSPW